MQRRSFLAGMLAACSAPVFIRSEILMPVRGLILPAANPIIRLDQITAEMLAVLNKNLQFTRNINRGWGSDNWGASTITVKRPPIYTTLAKG